MEHRDSGTIRTFAYGSNMLTVRIRERCPSAKVLGVATLCGYELKWHKRSQDGSGKCDIVRTDGHNAIVHGVVYEISANEKSDLDIAEGLDNGYVEEFVQVDLSNRTVSVNAYIATSVDLSLKPYTWYRQLVVAGAKEHGLPDQYIKSIEDIDAMQDRDRARHAKYTRIASANGVESDKLK